MAWLQEEARDAREMEGLGEIASMIDRQEAILITSVVTRTEVLRSKLDTKANAAFEEIFKRSNLQLCNVTEAIRNPASEIRDHGRNNGRNLKTPDAQHLATAITYKVNEMYTFDDKLLNLDGTGTGRPLTIRKPQGQQREMFS